MGVRSNWDPRSHVTEAADAVPARMGLRASYVRYTSVARQFIARYSACVPRRQSQRRVRWLLLLLASCSYYWLFRARCCDSAGTADSAPPAKRPYAVYVLTRRRFDLYSTFLPGGIGNIMFEYASVFGLAARHNKSFAVSLTDETSRANFAGLAAAFELDAVPVKRFVPGFAARVDEVGWGVHDERTDEPSFFNRSLAFYGYRQSWKYFNACSDAVRLAFRFRPELRSAAADFLAAQASAAAGRRRRRGTLFIGVHIRRGDMLRHRDLYTLAPPSYVLKAMDVYETRYGGDHDLIFVVATNDRKWSSSALDLRSVRPGDSVVYTAFNSTLDLAVLSSCNHSIVTVGTFGWWAGWLAGGDVVYYKDFIQASSGLYSTYRAADYYPPWWTGLR